MIIVRNDENSIHASLKNKGAEDGISLDPVVPSVSENFEKNRYEDLTAKVTECFVCNRIPSLFVKSIYFREGWF